MLLPGTSRPLGPAYDVNELVRLLGTVGYSLEEELKNLWELTRHPDPKVALTAQARWRSTLKDIRLANAVMLTMTRKEDGQTERTATAVALMDQLASENSNAKKQIAHEYHPPTAGSDRPDQTQALARAVFPGEVSERARDPEDGKFVDSTGSTAGAKLADAVRRNTAAGAGDRLTASRRTAAEPGVPDQPQGGSVGAGGGEGSDEGGRDADGPAGG